MVMLSMFMTLVDFVTEEAKNAGKNAAKYIKGKKRLNHFTEIKNGENISYTVPQKFEIESLDGNLNVFMRVRNVFKNKQIVVRDEEGNVIQSFKKPHVVPAEMERITILKDKLKNAKGAITISLEDGE